LDENYLGLDADGQLVSVTGCHSPMSDPYRDDYSEFHPLLGQPTQQVGDWQAECASTLSQRNTGRSDWETISNFYHLDTRSFQLHAPAAYNDNSGPATLPLAVTRIHEVVPSAPTTTLAAPIFALSDADGGRYLPGPGAQAILFQGQRLIDLGQPTIALVNARGARLGDTLCIYDLPAAHLGCKQIDAGDSQVQLAALPSWQPDLQMTPVNSTTLAITLTNVVLPPTMTLSMQIFPADADATNEQALTSTTSGYTGQISMTQPALDGYVRVWVNEPGTRREVVSAFTLGGNPAPPRRPQRRSRRRAPAISSDGSVILFADNLEFPAGEFFSIQNATALPAPPHWSALVGQGYRLLASPRAPSLEGVALNISYLEDDLAPGTEGGIGLYYWNNTSWTLIPSTTLDQERNEISSQAVGPGLYALMTSLNVHPGWNLVAYPWTSTNSLTRSLELINAGGDYTTVYGRVENDPNDQWQVYDVDVPTEWAPIVNDLTALQYGQGYWINVIAGNAAPMAQRTAPAIAAAAAENVSAPPATYYGIAPDISGASALTVEAWIGDTLCQTTQTQRRMIHGALSNVFVIDVPVDGEGNDSGCGSPRQIIDFKFLDGAQVVDTATAPWDNSRVHELRSPNPLFSTFYMPLISGGTWRTLDADLEIIGIELRPADPRAGQPTEVQLTIRNNGATQIDQSFWVDLYLDPRATPEINQIWPDLCTFGATWRVYALAPGETRTLSTLAPNDPQNPAQNYSNFTTFGPGAHTLYALVDSFAPGQDDGAIDEADEENNLLGPMTITASGSALTVAAVSPIKQRPGR
jgi:hypothetical protein